MDVAIHIPEYIHKLIAHHVSGHLKVTLQHLPSVFRHMRKPTGDFHAFMEAFVRISKHVGEEQYLVPCFFPFPKLRGERSGVG